MILFHLIYTLVALNQVSGFRFLERKDVLKDFQNHKRMLLQEDFLTTLGHNITLTPAEVTANAIIMKHKKMELDKGFSDPTKFAPSNSILKSLKEIEKSTLFQIIKLMPKGGILHAHDSALGNAKTLVGFTKKPNCWICVRKDTFLEFTYSKNKPPKGCETGWQRMSDYRKKERITDEQLEEKLTLNSKNLKENLNDAWAQFQALFRTVGGLIFFKDNFPEYVNSTLTAFLEDNVQYAELRSSFKGVYDLDGRKYSSSEAIEIEKKILKEFRKKNPSFISAKLIFSKRRHANAATVKEYLNEAMRLRAKFGDLMCGFDLVGQEDLGGPLESFSKELLEASNVMDFYFHAGETNWNGASTDENLFDAVLLQTKRIGHGYALNKHPLLGELVKQKDICIEISPISNQVLQLVKDLRNHPAAQYLASNYPIAISSDDPGFWGVRPLSHDFYVTFLGIASAHADIRTLKQLAYNSLQYSCMNPNLKQVAFLKFNKSWNLWIQTVIKKFGKL